MANVAITGLPVTTTMTDSTVLPVVESGTTYQISGIDLKTYIGASTAGGTMNYSQTLGTKVTISSPGTLVSTTITTSGAPVLISATGDANPQGSVQWVRLQIFRDGSPIGAIVQAENNNNINSPYCVQFIDNPGAGTYTYSLEAVVISGTIEFGETDGPTIIAIELTSGSGGGGSPAGANTEIQFNDNGAFGSDANLVYDNTSQTLTVTGTIGADTVFAGNSYVQYNVIATSYVDVVSYISTNQIDLSQGNYFAIDVGLVPVTLDVINFVPGPGPFVVSFTLEIKDGGTNVTWWPNLTWPGGIVPTLTTTGIDILEFYLIESGQWRGFVRGLDMK
jgi:hypothetical protein